MTVTVQITRFLFAAAIVAGLSAESAAGLHRSHGGSSCGCGSTTGPAWHPPMMTAVNAGCACSAAAATCCGSGGLLNVAGLPGHGVGMPFGAHTSGAWTGYEGLPNMDGGGVNYRYPYHSYRRPWFHPGPRATNISIVW